MAAAFLMVSLAVCFVVDIVESETRWFLAITRVMAK